jgi:aspartate/methionine/tyrosine aminotransferase
VTAFDQLEKFRARARSLLTTNRVLLDRFLESRSDLDCFRAPAGTVAFPKVMRGSAETLVTLLRDKYETSVVPGEFFDMPQHFRIGIGCETETLAKGLQRLGTALDELAGT